MKNWLNVLLLTAVFGAQSLTAQSGLLLGIETGIGSHTVRFSDSYQDGFSQYTGVTYETSRRMGLQGGLQIGWNFGKNFALLAAPCIMQKGTIYETAENGEFEFIDRNGDPFTAVGFVKWKEQYTAVQTPLLLSGRIPILGDRFGLTLSGGPSFNFMLSGKGEAVIETQTKTTPVESYEISFGNNRTDDYSGFDMSVLLAPGMAFDIDENGVFRVFAEARFDIGLRDMYTEKRKNFLSAEGIDILGTRKMRSTFFTIGVRYNPGFNWD